jgi:hypothetical protein
MLSALVGGASVPPAPAEELAPPEVQAFPLFHELETRPLPALARPLEPKVRQAHLLDDTPWVRALGKLGPVGGLSVFQNQ